MITKSPINLKLKLKPFARRFGDYKKIKITLFYCGKEVPLDK